MTTPPPLVETPGQATGPYTVEGPVVVPQNDAPIYWITGPGGYRRRRESAQAAKDLTRQNNEAYAHGVSHERQRQAEAVRELVKAGKRYVESHDLCVCSPAGNYRCLKCTFRAALKRFEDQPAEPARPA